MQYLGGKAKIAKRLSAPILDERRGREIWEPFCGGLGMTYAWGGGPLLLTDACEPLICLYQEYAAGWRPTLPVTVDDHARARGLADDHPFKAFALFGCSFGGMWGASFAKHGPPKPGEDPKRRGKDPAVQAANSLLKIFGSFTDTVFSCVDFCTVEPFPADGIIYCDPPYAGTIGYPGGPTFDRNLFVTRVEGWASAGVTVFVSELEFPLGECVLEIDHASKLNEAKGRRLVDRLYRVGPRA